MDASQMRQEFSDPPFNVAIDWNARKSAGSVMPFADRKSGIRFLQRICRGLSGMQRLRKLWQDQPGGAAGTRPNDRQLLELIADRLVRGDLQAFRIQAPLASGGGGGGSGGGGGGGGGSKPWTPDPALLGRRVEPPLRLAPRMPAPVADLLQEVPIVPDIGSQVATLLAAAKDGVPFCEQCAKDML